MKSAVVLSLRAVRPTGTIADKTAEKVDEFIKNTLDERYKHVLETLRTYGDAIEKMVEALYEEETIEGAKVRETSQTTKKSAVCLVGS